MKVLKNAPILNNLASKNVKAMIETDKKTRKEKHHKEVLRYMENARETLKKARKNGSLYEDKKYVKTACGIAYNAILLSLDALLEEKGSTTRKRKSIEWYREEVGKVKPKLLIHLNPAYETLHLAGYYDGNLEVKVIQAGFDRAMIIIEEVFKG